MERLKILGELSLIMFPMFLANVVTFFLVIQIKDFSSLLFFILVTVINFGGAMAGAFLIEVVKQKSYIKWYKRLFWYSVKLTDTGPASVMAAEDWAHNNVSGKWNRDFKTFHFSKKDEAILFKLACF